MWHGSPKWRVAMASVGVVVGGILATNIELNAAAGAKHGTTLNQSAEAPKFTPTQALQRGRFTGRPRGALSLGSVTGFVVNFNRDQRKEHPIAGATVELPEYGLRTRSSEDGLFRFRALPVVMEPCTYVRAVARATGFGDWVMKKVALFPRSAFGSLEVDIHMRKQDYRIPYGYPPWDPDGNKCHRIAHR